MTISVLQTTCGALTIASLVALGQPPTAIAAHDGAAPLVRTYAAIPTEWDRGGPLAIPTIGVAPPRLEDWYDPTAPRPFPASTAARSTLTVSTPVTTSPVRSVHEPEPAPPPTAVDESTDPTPTEPPQSTTSPTDAAPAGTTAQETTTPPSTTAAPTSASPATTSPTTTPTTTEPPASTEEPAPTPPTAVETNERGNAVLGLGEQLAVLDAETGALVLAVAVDSVSVDVTCTSRDATPPAGHLIAVRVRATTGPDLAAVGGEPAVRAADFTFLGPDGVPLAPAGTPGEESCIPDTEAFPVGPLGADMEFAGVVVLDVPAVAGTLVFSPESLTVGGEWTY